MTLPKYVPPTYNPPAYNPPAPKPVTPPAGYTIDGNGNLQLLPGYYTDNSGNAKPNPPVFNPPQPVSPIPQEYYPPAYNPPAPKPVYSQDDIRAFVNANISDPAKIQQAMAQYGVDTNQIAQAMGVDPGTVTSYFNNYNQGPSQTAQPPVYPSTPQPNPAPQATFDNTGGVVPYQLPDGSTIMIPAGTLGAEPTPQ